MYLFSLKHEHFFLIFILLLKSESKSTYDELL